MSEPAARQEFTDDDAESLAVALHDGEIRLPRSGARYRMRTEDLGTFPVPSGRLRVGDLAPMPNDAVVRVPPGDLRAVVTHSEPLDFDIVGPRVSHLSLLVPGRTEARRGPLAGEDVLAASDGSAFAFFCVDAGSCCCVDDVALRAADVSGDFELPEFGEGRILPVLGGGKGPLGAICHSGIGDGVYPVLGGYDADGRLAAVHVDFGVLPVEQTESPEACRLRVERASAAARRQARWRAVWLSLGVLAAGVGLITFLTVMIHRQAEKRSKARRAATVWPTPR